MMESGKHNDLKWGNRLGYIMLPFEIVMHKDPLDYVRNAKKTVDRKKHSLEAIVTHAITVMITKLFGIEVYHCNSTRFFMLAQHGAFNWAFTYFAFVKSQQPNQRG
jgi:hypothetical protein